MEKLLKTGNNLFLYALLIVLILGQFSSCSKTGSSLSNSSTFLKTYQTDSTAGSVYLEQLPDQGFVIISSEGVGGRPVITRTDKSGNLMWQRIIQKNCFPGYSSPNVNIWNAFNTIDAGHFIAQSNGRLTLFDTLGHVEDSIFI